MSHAKLSASGSSTWLNCPASIRISSGIEDSSTAYAEEGTRAHATAEALLLGKEPPSPEMVGTVEPYTLYIRELTRADSTLLVEQRLDFSEWVTDGFGTGDAVILHTDGSADIVDLKYGMGVKVDAVENSQLRLYAMGLLQAYQYEHGITQVRIHIVQPRLDHISTEVLSASELLEWGEWVKQRAALTADPTAPAIPSAKACRWCRARSICRARALDALRVAGSDHLTPADIDLLLPLLDGITAWISDVKTVATELAEEGKLTTYKLVEGRSVRKLTDDAAGVLLQNGLTEEDVYRKEYRTLSDIERMLGGKKKAAPVLEQCTIKPSGKPVLVPNSDPRPAIAADVTLNFQIGE